MKEAGKIHVVGRGVWEQTKRPGVAGECFGCLDIPSKGLAEQRSARSQHWELTAGSSAVSETTESSVALHVLRRSLPPPAADPWAHLVTVAPARLAAVW